MLRNHPITNVLLATDLAAAREFCHGKLGRQPPGGSLLSCQGISRDPLRASGFCSRG
jgi:hypothetical protein